MFELAMFMSLYSTYIICTVHATSFYTEPYNFGSREKHKNGRFFHGSIIKVFMLGIKSD